MPSTLAAHTWAHACTPSTLAARVCPHVRTLSTPPGRARPDTRVHPERARGRHLNIHTPPPPPSTLTARSPHTRVPPSPAAPTSAWMLGTEPVKPFSAMALWELLGELGPEPGALLHTEDTAGPAGVIRGGCHPRPHPCLSFPSQSGRPREGRGNVRPSPRVHTQRRANVRAQAHVAKARAHVLHKRARLARGWARPGSQGEGRGVPAGGPHRCTGNAR